MTKRIFRSIFFASLIVLVCNLLLVLGVLYNNFEDRLQTEFRNEASYVMEGIKAEGTDYLNALPKSNSRITWVDATGTVLYDSWSDASQMENHAEREEIQEALQTGKGESSRYSDTLAEKILYYAQRLDDGSVLRISNTQNSVLALLKQLLPALVLMLAVAIVLSLVLASQLSKRIIKPLNNIDLEHPENEDCYEEVTPLLSRIHKQNNIISRQIAQLRQKQEEFETITGNMSEGFLLVDKNMQVLSYNQSALKLLGYQGKDAHNENIFAIHREANFRHGVDDALAGKHSEELLILGGRHYRMIANPVYQDKEPAGAVLVIMDVTEQEQREHLRREFTANVSHELKTPLTAISGTAEILQNGLVKPQDIPHFAGNIYKEAQRLITLVGDIIRLSQLDEGVVTEQQQKIDLLSVAQGVQQRLMPLAKEKKITFQVEGEAAFVEGIPSILEDMIYNLCDNAIKYNRQGGQVMVEVQGGEHPMVRVADTGIGIAPEEQERVFERFYRVDKSHSGETEGTGLGLSIVKHGAAYHRAAVELKSIPGKGTAVTLRW